MMFCGKEFRKYHCTESDDWTAGRGENASVCSTRDSATL